MFTLGSDPELMLVDKKTGALVSAIEVIDGVKHNPTRLANGQVIHDNVMVEFGIEPAKSEDEWVDNTREMLEALNSIIPNRLEMKAWASANFPEAELEHPEAKEFACEPDFDPYTVSINFIDDGAADNTLRSCGGHIHIGNKEIASDIDNQIEFAKVMDLFLGIPSIVLDKDPSSKQRRELYGKAGAHRPKPYGLEYRALGNFWVSHPKYCALMYKMSRDALEAWSDGLLKDIKWDLVRKTINFGSENKAKQGIEKIVINFLSSDTRQLFEECLELDMPDLYKSWGI